MPTAVPEYDEYYGTNHRRHLSRSQTNLPDHSERHQPYSPNRSAVLLPSTTYNQPPPFQPQSRSRAPSLSNSLAQIDTGLIFSSANPDDFYRQYPSNTDTLNAASGNLHQDALRTLESRDYQASRAGSNSSYATDFTTDDPQDTALPLKVPGLRARKASVKNLVAQINASSFIGAPPIPTRTTSDTYLNHGSVPYLSSANVSQIGGGQRTQANLTVGSNATPFERARGGEADNQHPQRPESHTGQRRPLFGEVVPGGPPVNQSAGYGILNPKRRTGSEGSPMHSPNPMFPRDQVQSQFVLSPVVYTSNNQRPNHRRTNSDMPQSPVNADMMTSALAAHRPPVTSRIPVSKRRMSAASDSGIPTPHSSNTPIGGKLQQNNDFRSTPQRSTSPKQSLSVDRSAKGRITSPGRRGRPPGAQQISVQQGAKSPSLRANIIAPPPKISPPLRSSRPRATVASASTAASRARMAEKFATMQKMNSEKRAAQQRRGKPPELTDIDLDARRLRITQALTRSRESDELKDRLQTGRRWEPGSRTASPKPASVHQRDRSSDAPRISIDNVSSGNTTDVYDEGHDRQYATRSALHAMHGQSTPDTTHGDSPTLAHGDGPYEKPVIQLQTSFLAAKGNAEPMSALTDVTVATEATHIDPEPQDDDAVDAPSLLSHVMQMRDKSPVGQYEQSPQISNEHEDRADVESVNLVFRNTAYLDDDEAISKGYRTNFVAPDPLPEEPEIQGSNRESWTSSMHEDTDQEGGYFHQPRRGSQGSQTRSGHDDSTMQAEHANQSETYRDTMASDAYTIINIVLQEHSSSGLVDQQFAEDVYLKVLETCPEIEDEGSYDQEKIEHLCMQELIRRDEDEQTESRQDQDNHSDSETPQIERPEQHVNMNPSRFAAELAATNENLTLPSTRYAGHRYKSSLDSAEDWASTSPSIGDWMRLASDNTPPPTQLQLSELQAEQASDNQVIKTEQPATSDKQLETSASLKSIFPPAPLDPDEDTLGPEEYGIAIIRAPSHSPPPPPKDSFPSIAQTTKAAMTPSAEPAVRMPRVPHRVTSLGQVQMSRDPQPQSQSQSRPPSSRSRVEAAPWEAHDQPEESPSPESSRLKKRKHIIKELVDTEFTYQRDMRVLCDIYKQTATAALTEDDIKVLFGNVEEVQVFARDFLTALKQTSKSSSVVERKKDKREGLESLIHTNSSSSTLASSKLESDASDMQKDRETRIGDAFEGSLVDMETVYTEYIRNRHAANSRLETLQRSTAAQEWLKECRDNSSDITNAWNLDALLVKPVQRITKYPLLLKELIDASCEDHPDLPTLRRALGSVTDISMRINDLKRHAEALDQVLNRKRGQSDVRTGLSKAFGRRAEKLRQHVGITDMYEDTEYDKVRIAYDNNYVQLMVVANDCQSYEKGIALWVNKMVEIAAAAEGWVDVGHSHHQQEESKLRHLAMIIRNVHNIALPDHLEHLQKKVVKPMTTTVDILTKFKDDPRGLLHKRDKRLVDYAQMKNRKDRGEKIDKKMAERMDQWEALNTEAKERMKKLLRATGHLVQACQGHLVQLQMSWMAMIQQKFSSVMGINLNRVTPEDIEKDWQIDFDYQEASALALGICNGSLMLQAANMTSFLTPGSTLNGDDSPRQMSFGSTNNKRSISMNSDTSTVATLEHSSRPSGTYIQPLPESHFDRPYPYPNGRTRAVSTTSGKSLHRPETASRASTNSKHISASANFARPGTSPVMQQDGFAPPRLSVETHSPLMEFFQPSRMPERPVSSSTFFSAAAGSSQSQSGQRARGSGVFTSALPMSDSPVQERHTFDHAFSEPQVLFTAASVYEFNIDRARREAGFPYLTYVTGEIFDVIGERGELWLAKNQDDPNKQVGWIWNKHFAKLAE